jgi:hypothetical protein
LNQGKTGVSRPSVYRVKTPPLRRLRNIKELRFPKRRLFWSAVQNRRSLGFN